MNNIYKSLVLLAILAGIGLAYYTYRTNTYITAEFKDLRPFHDKAPIYYNGFKIGRVIKVRPNKEYTATIVTMELHPQDLKLPINMGVHLKIEKNKHNKKFDYIDLVYPENPSSFYLKTGDRLAGKNTVDFETYLANQDPESLDAIKADFAESVKSLNITIQTIGELFGTLNSMAEDVKPNVVKASSDLSSGAENFVKISENVHVLSDNVNGALTEDRMNSTAKNLQITTKNIKLLTNEVNKTVPQLGCTVTQMNRVLCNIEEMTTGLNCTLKKHFGGLRLFFGKPISKCK